LIHQHGTGATVQAVKRTDERFAAKDLEGALACMLVAEAVGVLLTDKPEDGERVH
jgi:hypothetical protein